MFDSFQPARHTKLEKADILEMTVKHLQSIQRQHLSAAVASDPTVVHKFKTGFNECASEVSRYIGNLEGIDNGVKKRLVSHLSSCISEIQPLSLPSGTNSFSTTHEIRTSNSEDLNNNHNEATRFSNVSGLQLIPSRLPSGELALLLPNSSSLSSLFPNTLDLTNRSHISAFTPVSKDIKLLSGSEDVSLLKHESSQSEVSSTSNDGMSFKTPHTPTKSLSHTNYTASSSLLIPVTELNSEYKKDRYCLSSCDRSSIFKPLTVYTDPSFELARPISRNSPLCRKSPLDFSLKKEQDETPSSTDRMAKKRPLEDLPCNIQLPPSKSLKITSQVKQEYNSNRDFNAAGDSNTNADMWRPW